MIEDYELWWNTLSFLQKIYWGVSIPSTLAMVIVIIMTIIGGDIGDDFDIDADGDFDADDVNGFHLFSFKNLIGFFTVFGWTGLGFIEMKWSLVFILGISFTCGFAMMLIMAWTWYMLSKLNTSGTLKLSNAINTIGKAYLPISSNGESSGKVQVTIQGSLRTMNAVTEDKEDIKTGDQIRVIGTKDDNTLVVTKEFN